MTDNTTTFTRIDRRQHARMKQLAELKGTESLLEEYRMAVEAWLSQESQKIILADSQIQEIMESRLTKMEDRVVKMIARNGMDVAMVLMGVANLLAKKYNVAEKDILNELRPIAAKHFSNPKKDSMSDE